MDLPRPGAPDFWERMCLYMVHDIARCKRNARRDAAWGLTGPADWWAEQARRGKAQLRLDRAMAQRVR